MKRPRNWSRVVFWLVIFTWLLCFAVAACKEAEGYDLPLPTPLPPRKWGVKSFPIACVEQMVPAVEKNKDKIALRVEVLINRNTYPQGIPWSFPVAAALYGQVRDKWEIVQIDRLIWTGKKYKRDDPGPYYVDPGKDSPHCKGADVVGCKPNGRYAVRIILFAKNRFQNMRHQGGRAFLVKEAKTLILQGRGMRILEYELEPKPIAY